MVCLVSRMRPPKAAALVVCRRHRTCACGRVCSPAVLQVDLKADVKICIGGAVL